MFTRNFPKPNLLCDDVHVTQKLVFGVYYCRVHILLVLLLRTTERCLARILFAEVCV